MTHSLYDIRVTFIDGTSWPMDRFRGHVLLIVNVASRCGFTGQYAGLESMYRQYKDRGLLVLGFPCDQFGHQEPGTDAEIREFCSLTYDVTFPMFGKIKVNGHETHPLYRYLKTHRKGVFGLGRIKWNFSKFLVSRAGEVIGRYGPRDTPASIEPAVETALSGV